MLQIRKSVERGTANHGWLKATHSFSFADYYDPRFMGFKSLRVINEDRIAGGRGFGAHPHRDMEIITYIVAGSLQHADSMGMKAVIRPGEVQYMSAGSGVTHSEMNAELNSETHLFQIWIQPSSPGGKPKYGQKSFEAELNSKPIVLVASKDAREGSIGIRQDVDMHIARMQENDTLNFKLRKGRGLWLQVVRGKLKVQGEKIETGDAVAIVNDAENEADEINVLICADKSSEIIIFDLA